MRILLMAALSAFGLDQITKIWVVFGMDLKNRLAIDVLPPLLNFRYGENRGINFGLLRWLFEILGETGSALFLAGLSIVICSALCIWAMRQPPHRGLRFAAGLVIGGALGNVLDRLVYGYVLDFLNMSCCGINNPFVFNIADVFIFGGAAGLILFESQLKKPA